MFCMAICWATAYSCASTGCRVGIGIVGAAIIGNPAKPGMKGGIAVGRPAMNGGGAVAAIVADAAALFRNLK